DSKYISLSEAPRPYLYLPLRPFYNATTGLAFHIRTASDPAALLPFDMAGSDKRKLELQLAEPLRLEAGAHTMLDGGQGSILASAGLGWSVSEDLRLGVQVDSGASQFTSLGSIHCQDGILEAGSYRASNCYFTQTGKRNSVSLGAEYEIGGNMSAGINLFREQSELGQYGVRGATGRALPLGRDLRRPILPGLTGADSALLPGYLDSELGGIDLEFQLGVSTDRAGEMQLGLQFTRILDAEFSSAMPFQDQVLPWTLAEPVDSARLSFDWQRNAFSGGIQGFYREPISFLNGSEVDGTTMFDVYFSWRTPWNASLSVGASNLLGTGQDEGTQKEATLNDPFEAVYGRIPYVRYQQDL
ncbi:MAG: hypothetical protein R3348_07905, partial [Xanthomonadales bacterium]|nr:hypothetical protein [Xanthomonadales bacterium]